MVPEVLNEFGDSSEKSVGEFGLGQFAKCVLECLPDEQKSAVDRKLNAANALQDRAATK